jgi:hypothetical protein
MQPSLLCASDLHTLPPLLRYEKFILLASKAYHSVFRYFCRFVLNGAVPKACPVAVSIDSFWKAFPATSRVFKNHYDAMNTKTEVIATLAWNVTFTRLADGLEKYSTLRQQLVASDPVVSLVLVFRDEAFRCMISVTSHLVASHPVCRRPFALKTKLHSELCRCTSTVFLSSLCILIMLPPLRFKQSDELSSLFKFAFLVCSNHEFDAPPAPIAGEVKRQQACSCSSTGSVHPILQLF